MKITCANSVLIFERMDLEKSLRNILFEYCCHLPLCTGIDIAIATTTAEQATQLDHGEAADRYRHHRSQKAVKFVRSRFVQVALSQSARIDVNWIVQRSSRSWRIKTSLGTSWKPVPTGGNVETPLALMTLMTPRWEQAVCHGDEGLEDRLIN
jgi:hypothetical protein